MRKRVNKYVLNLDKVSPATSAEPGSALCVEGEGDDNKDLSTKDQTLFQSTTAIFLNVMRWTQFEVQN